MGKKKKKVELMPGLELASSDPNVAPTKLQQYFTDAPSILDTASILGVSSVFRTPSSEY